MPLIAPLKLLSFVQAALPGFTPLLTQTNRARLQNAFKPGFRSCTS
jgi:hypothetical protein